jgi:hypothetical protein
MKYLRYVGRGKKCTPLFLFGGASLQKCVKMRPDCPNQPLPIGLSSSLSSLSSISYTNQRDEGVPPSSWTHVSVQSPCTDLAEVKGRKEGSKEGSKHVGRRGKLARKKIGRRSYVRTIAARGEKR